MPKFKIYVHSNACVSQKIARTPFGEIPVPMQIEAFDLIFKRIGNSVYEVEDVFRREMQRMMIDTKSYRIDKVVSCDEAPAVEVCTKPLL